MERLFSPDESILPINKARSYQARSILDMLSSSDQIIEEIRNEHTRWVRGSDFRQRLSYRAILLGQYLNDTIPGSIYLTINKGQKLPHIEVAPRAMVLLPKIQHDPSQDKDLSIDVIRIHDMIGGGSIEVEFPYGVIAEVARSAGFKLNKKALRESYWSSLAILFNIYGSRPRSFLIYLNILINQRANERVEEKLNLASNLSLNNQGL